jgi:hypothetical protein
MFSLPRSTLLRSTPVGLLLWALSAALVFAQSPYPNLVSTNSVPIAISTATTTQLIALAASKSIAITSLNIIATGTGNIQFVYGTGSNCGTGQANLTGNYNLTAQAGLAFGDGIAPILIIPPGNALCAVTSASVGIAGSVSYAQF